MQQPARIDPSATEEQVSAYVCVGDTTQLNSTKKNQNPR